MHLGARAGIGWYFLIRQRTHFIGDPAQVIEKILYQHEHFAHQRFLIQLGVGTLPHAKTLRAIELLGTVVAPAVRKEVARRTSGLPQPGRAPHAA